MALWLHLRNLLRWPSTYPLGMAIVMLFFVCTSLPSFLFSYYLYQEKKHILENKIFHQAEQEFFSIHTIWQHALSDPAEKAFDLIHPLFDMFFKPTFLDGFFALSFHPFSLLKKSSIFHDPMDHREIGKNKSLKKSLESLIFQVIGFLETSGMKNFTFTLSSGESLGIHRQKNHHRANYKVFIQKKIPESDGASSSKVWHQYLKIFDYSDQGVLTSTNQYDIQGQNLSQKKLGSQNLQRSNWPRIEKIAKDQKKKGYSYFWLFNEEMCAPPAWLNPFEERSSIQSKRLSLIIPFLKEETLMAIIHIEIPWSYLAKIFHQLQQRYPSCDSILENPLTHVVFSKDEILNPSLSITTQHSRDHIFKKKTLSPLPWVLHLKMNTWPIWKIFYQEQTHNFLWFLGRILFFYGILFLALHQFYRNLKIIEKFMQEMMAYQYRNCPQSYWPFKELKEIFFLLCRISKGLSIFQKTLSAPVTKALLQQGETVLKGVRSPLSMMFCRIGNFSHILSQTSNEYLVQYCSNYFKICSEMIAFYQGTIDKYIGETIMAFWGAPFAVPQHSEAMCKAALSIVSKSQSPDFDQNDFPLQLQLGLATGNVILGASGVDHYKNYTILGDKVNLASRISKLNDYYGTRILVDEETYQENYKKLIFRPVDFLRVHGKDQPCMIYELLASYEKEFVSVHDPMIKSTEIYRYMEFVVHSTQAWQAYRKGCFKEAKILYQKILTILPSDRLSQRMSKRCDILTKKKKSAKNFSFDGMFYENI